MDIIPRLPDELRKEILSFLPNRMVLCSAFYREEAESFTRQAHDTGVRMRRLCLRLHDAKSNNKALIDQYREALRIGRMPDFGALMESNCLMDDLRMEVSALNKVYTRQRAMVFRMMRRRK